MDGRINAVQRDTSSVVGVSLLFYEISGATKQELEFNVAQWKKTLTAGQLKALDDVKNTEGAAYGPIWLISGPRWIFLQALNVINTSAPIGPPTYDDWLAQNP